MEGVSAMPIALITGASRGLGRNIATHLAQSGVEIIATYKSNKGEADQLVKEIERGGRRAAALALDAGDIAGFGRFASEVCSVLAETFGAEKFDYLVNNAGFGRNTPLAAASEADFDALVNVHFKGVFFLTQKLAPMMSDGGAIVNLSSGLSRFSLPGYSVYGALKGAIDVLTRFWAQELGARRIRVNALAPGAIETDFGGGAVRDNPEINRMIAAQTALGRVGLPDDIGKAAAFLLSDEAGWINGQRVEVSGGIHL
jgi:NAD(P)-dependent dehydrogenase (short-subunit alcohol dehydrogenase family)